MKVTRRNAMVMGAFAPAGEFAVPGGGSIDVTTQGISVRLAWARPHLVYGRPYPDPDNQRQWAVMVPDWESIGDYWHPGMPVQYKWVPLKDFLCELEKEFNLVPKT